MGLQDMGWSIDLFKIHESQPVLPIAKFRDTVSNVIEYLSKDLNDQGLVTIHIWLSLQFLHDVKPPHSVLVLPPFQKEFIKCVTDLDQVASRPVIVAINTDSLFNGVDSITSRLAVELTEGLKREGVMVMTDQRMWRSMRSQFSSQFTTMRATKRGTLGKSAIWSVIEKNLFRQRVLLMCATNREHVSTLNEGAYRPKDSGVDAEMLADVTGPTQVFRIASGDMTPDDYAKGDATIYTKRAHPPQAQLPQDSTRTSGTRPSGSNRLLDPMSLNLRNHSLVIGSRCILIVLIFFVNIAEPPRPWMQLKLLSTSPLRASIAQKNTQDHYRKSAPTLGARKSVLLLAARLKVAFKNCGLDRLDISKDFQKWLVFAAASVISNKQLKYGEELMKSLSHMGGVRIPHNQAKEIFKNGRGKQFSIYRERIDSMTKVLESGFWLLGSPKIAATSHTKISSNRLRSPR